MLAGRLWLVAACALLALSGGLAVEWSKISLYQVLTDRFAPDHEGTSGCSDLHHYCGGTYKGLVRHLDYIAGLGFQGIWISPVVSQIDLSSGDGYHGYWLRNLSQLNEHFGGSSDLLALVQACHARNMVVVVDVVCNHVGPVDMDFSAIYPFNQASHYHAKCEIHDWNNQYEVENCRLANLPDLDQDNNFVRSALLEWGRALVTKYKIDGLRIDTVPEVPKTFWRAFRQAVGVFSMGEVLNGRIDYVASYQADVLDSVMSYPLFFAVRDAFRPGGSLRGVESVLSQYAKHFHDLSVLGVFLDNHDNARFLSFIPDSVKYKAALTFTLMAEGIPILYYGSEQGFSGGDDPRNREPLWPHFDTSAPLYQHIQSIMAFRKAHIGEMVASSQIQRYADDQFYAFTRGKVFVAVTNVGSGGAQQVRSITYHPYADGTRLCNHFYPSDCIKVEKGAFSVYLNNGEAKIFFPA